MDVRIQATPEVLADLRQFLIHEMKDDLDLQEISSVSPSGELREPLLIGLVVALGGSSIVTGFVEVVKRWMEYREKIKALEYQHEEKIKEAENLHQERLRKIDLQFAILNKEGYEQVTLEDLSIRAREMT